MRKLKCLIGCLIILAFLFYYQPFFLWLVKPLIVKDSLKTVDAIVIFGDDLKAEDKICPDVSETMDYSLKLFQDGYGSRVVLSGGKLQGNKKEALVMYDYALNKGFSPESFYLEQSSQKTKERVQLTSKMLTEKKYKSILLVTPPYQSALVKQMFKDNGIEVISSPVPNNNFYSVGGQDKIKAFQLVANEYLNKVYYDLFH